MKSYIALVHKDKQSVYGISFPDFLGCISFAESLEEIQKNSLEVLQLHIEGMLEDGQALPEPTSLDMCQDRTAVAYLLVPVNVKKPVNIVRFNATMEEGLLGVLDKMAQGSGKNRSAMIADLVKNALEAREGKSRKKATKDKIVKNGFYPSNKKLVSKNTG